MKRLAVIKQPPGRLRKDLLWLCLIGVILIGLPGLSLAGAASPSGSVPVTRVVLDNGLTVLVKPNPANDVVTVKLFLRMGVYYETREERGISILMQKILTRGTSVRTAAAIDQATESLGATIKAGLEGDDYGSVSLKTTVAGFEPSLEVFLDIIEHPSFPVAELEKERQMTLDHLAAAGDQPANMAFYNFKKLFYGELPYGTTPAEYTRTIARLQRADLLDWYRRIYIPNNMVLSIVGRVEPQAVIEKLRAGLAKLPAGEPLLPSQPEGPVIQQNQTKTEAKVSRAAFMVLGYPAPDWRSSDAPAMDLLNWIIGGGGMGSRLFTKLRDEQGLAYSVSTEYVKNEGASYLFAFMATNPANLKAAQAGLIQEFQNLCQTKITDTELAAAKKAMRGSYLMQHETNGAQGDLLGSYELLGLGYQYDVRYPEMIGQVTAEEIQQVAKKYINHYTLSVAGPVQSGQ